MAQFLMRSGGSAKEQARRRTEVTFDNNLYTNKITRYIRITRKRNKS